MTHRSASRCVHLLVPASRIILFVNFVIPVVEGLSSVVDALSLYDLPGAGFSCMNLPRSEVFPAKCCGVVGSGVRPTPGIASQPPSTPSTPMPRSTRLAGSGTADGETPGHRPR